MKKIRIVTLIVAIGIPLLVGGISAAISASGMDAYGTMNKPPLAPPSWLFPVAWTLLYIMMGLASYFIYVSDEETEYKVVPLTAYIVQLAMNFMWSIVFFVWGMYLLAFVWLMIMWCIVIFCAIKFFKISRTATYLFIPYIVWLTFAAYLNLGAYILN